MWQGQFESSDWQWPRIKSAVTETGVEENSRTHGMSHIKLSPTASIKTVCKDRIYLWGLKL